MSRNTMATVAGIIAGLLTFMILSACTTQTEAAANAQQTPTFPMEFVKAAAYSFDYYRDAATDVMYLKADNTRGVGLTIMLDPETGLPLTYTRYLELAAK